MVRISGCNFAGALARSFIVAQALTVRFQARLLFKNQLFVLLNIKGHRGLSFHQRFYNACTPSAQILMGDIASHILFDEPATRALDTLSRGDGDLSGGQTSVQNSDSRYFEHGWKR